MKYLSILYLLSFALALLALSSCDEKIYGIEFDVPFEGEKLVVYGVITNVSDPSMTVYRTKDPLEGGPTEILSDIKATLIDNDEITTSFNFEENVGNCPVEVSIDKSYSIVVEHEDLIVHSSEVHLPNLVPIDSVIYYYNHDSSDVLFDVYFEDEPDLKNYYSYEIRFFEDGVLKKVDGPGLDYIFAEDGIEIQNNKLTIEHLRYFPIYGENYSFQEAIYVSDVEISLFNVSKNIYESQESFYSNYSGIGEAFSEKNPTFTNINGGYGYWGAASISRFNLIVE